MWMSWMHPQSVDVHPVDGIIRGLDAGLIM
jgi:hypothetical protein